MECTRGRVEIVCFCAVCAIIRVAIFFNLTEMTVFSIWHSLIFVTVDQKTDTLNEKKVCWVPILPLFGSSLLLLAFVFTFSLQPEKVHQSCDRVLVKQDASSVWSFLFGKLTAVNVIS